MRLQIGGAGGGYLVAASGFPFHNPELTNDSEQ
jgi:K+-transporting ATPase A subunit